MTVNSKSNNSSLVIMDKGMVCYYLICKLDCVEKPIYKLNHTYVCAGLIVVTGFRRIYLLAVVIDCCFVIKCSVIKFILVTMSCFVSLVFHEVSRSNVS